MRGPVPDPELGRTWRYQLVGIYLDVAVMLLGRYRRFRSGPQLLQLLATLFWIGVAALLIAGLILAEDPVYGVNNVQTAGGAVAGITGNAWLLLRLVYIANGRRW